MGQGECLGHGITHGTRWVPRLRHYSWDKVSTSTWVTAPVTRSMASDNRHDWKEDRLFALDIVEHSSPRLYCMTCCRAPTSWGWGGGTWSRWRWTSSAGSTLKSWRRTSRSPALSSYTIVRKCLDWVILCLKKIQFATLFANPCKNREQKLTKLTRAKKLRDSVDSQFCE